MNSRSFQDSAIISPRLILNFLIFRTEPITVAARSKAVFAHPNGGIVGSNSTRGMDICVRLFCGQVATLRRADPPSKGPTDSVQD
jgi:hypothetical protein